MNSILYTGIMVVLWILNLFNGTGLGSAFQTTERARLLIYLIFLIIVITNAKKNIKPIYYLIIAMPFFFIAVSYLKGYNYMGLHYVSSLMLVYILSKLRVNVNAVRLTGIAYAVMGMAVLVIYDFGSLLSGWNGNSIGMIGLYSYLVFLIPLYNVKSLSSKIIIIAVTVLYAFLIGPTDSRSCILFAIIGVLFALSILPRRLIIRTDRRYYLWLLIPLFVAIFVIIVSKGPYMDAINIWSYTNFEKPIFNGRDKIWEMGFQKFYADFIMGSGNLNAYNWHNCVIHCLTSYGIIGFILWIVSFKNILSIGRPWINDIIVQGCIITFIIIYLQQSVELGLISESPNLLPYVILGMMLGRVKELNIKNEKASVEQAYEKDNGNNTDLQCGGAS